MGQPGFSVGQGNTQIYSGNKAALANISREQGNEPNFGGLECGNLEHNWDNKPFETSADSDQLRIRMDDITFMLSVLYDGKINI